nr:PREDICTED: PTB-containing, cubilin and LRP1-interacting protein [Equus przewalskii]
MINIVKPLLEKVQSMHEPMGNFSKEVETIEKNQEKLLGNKNKDKNNRVTEMKMAFNELFIVPCIIPNDLTVFGLFCSAFQHFQTMLKSKLNVLTLKKEPLPTVIFHEPEAIELCTTTPLMKARTHSGCKVTYLGKVPTTGMQFLSGCTEKPVIELWKKHTLAREDVFPANALLEIRPFQVWLHHLDHKGEATVHMDTFQVARIAYCTADHNVSPNIFAWVYREINDDLSYQMDCHAVECESKLEAKKLAHAMMEAFRKTFHSMKSDGRIHRNSSSEEVSQELESDDG